MEKKYSLQEISDLRDAAGSSSSKKDNDSFSEVVGGVRSNWMIIMAAFSVCFWLISNTFEIKNTNNAQDSRISSNETAIVNLNKDYKDFQVKTESNFEAQSNVNGEILRTLQSVQKDIEFIKTK